eukprot:scaffold177754_cov31-Tisochrysis_lutea.AAC.1
MVLTSGKCTRTPTRKGREREGRGGAAWRDESLSLSPCGCAGSAVRRYDGIRRGVSSTASRPLQASTTPSIRPGSPYHASSPERLSDALDEILENARPAQIPDIDSGRAGRSGENGVFFRHTRRAGGTPQRDTHCIRGAAHQLERHAARRSARAALPRAEQPALRGHVASGRGDVPGGVSAQAAHHSILHRHAPQEAHLETQVARARTALRRGRLCAAPLGGLDRGEPVAHPGDGGRRRSVCPLRPRRRLAREDCQGQRAGAHLAAQHAGARLRTPAVSSSAA